MKPGPPTAPDPDADLVRRVQAGETDAFEPLVLRYQDPIYNAALRMTGHRDDAAEIVQELFVRLFRTINDFRYESRFSTYLWRSLINDVISYRRKKTVRQKVWVAPFGPGDPTDQPPELDPADPDQPTPVDQAGDAEAVEAIRQAIPTLDEPFRTVVVLRDLQGMDYDQISDLLDLPIGTLKSRLHRARSQLREKLADYT